MLELVYVIDKSHNMAGILFLYFSIIFAPKLNRMNQKACLSLLALFISFSVFSQARFPVIDKSPMDICYYPVNYPILKIQNKATEPLIVRVSYSRPQKMGVWFLENLLNSEKYGDWVQTKPPKLNYSKM